VQTFIAVNTGSRNDPAETTGLAHYLEHLMFKGTQQFGTTDYAKEKPYLDEIERRYEQYRTLTDPVQRRTAYHQIDSVSQLAAQYNIPNEYDKLMSSIGSEGTNAYTSNDVTCYVENIPTNEIDNWARIQADRFQNMVIRGFHTELEAVYEEKNISMASDGSKEYAALWKLLTPTHPYGTQTTIGEQEHLKNPSIVNIKNYFHRYYVPNNVAIVLAGDFNPDETIAIIDKYFGQWKPSTNLTRPEFPAQSKITAQRDTTVVGQDAENLMMAWRFKGENDMQSDTLDLVRHLLYNGQAGLIDINLLQPMKVQDVGVDFDGLHDYSAFIIEASPLHGQTLQQVKKLLLGQINKLARGEFSEQLLPAVMANKKLHYFEDLQNNILRASFMVHAFVNDKRWEDVALQLDRQAKITKQDIQHFVSQHFGENNLVCVYKRQGVDSTLKKIEKPIITPIPANREYESALLKSIRLSKTTPIQPKFLDFSKELSLGKFLFRCLGREDRLERVGVVSGVPCLGRNGHRRRREILHLLPLRKSPHTPSLPCRAYRKTNMLRCALFPAFLYCGIERHPTGEKSILFELSHHGRECFVVNGFPLNEDSGILCFYTSDAHAVNTHAAEMDKERTPRMRGLRKIRQHMYALCNFPLQYSTAFHAAAIALICRKCCLHAHSFLPRP